MLDAIKTYVTSILKAMELADPIDEKVVMRIVDRVFMETFDDLIEEKIEQEKRREYADTLMELVQRKDQASFQSHIMPLGTSEEINKKTIEKANELLAALIEELKRQNYITEENLAKLGEYMQNPTDLIEFDKQTQEAT